MKSLPACGCFPTGGPWPGLAQLGAAGAMGLVPGLDPDLPWAQIPLAVIDVETTGLDPQTDRVVEVGVLPVDFGVVGEGRGWLVNPGRAVPPEALAVHGLTDAELLAAPAFASIATEIAEALAGRVPVAYNADFDRLFLAVEYDRLGVVRPPCLRRGVEWLDPLVWARLAQRAERGHKLTDVAARLGIDVGQSHRALHDARTAAKILLALGDVFPPTYMRLVRHQKDYATAQDLEIAASRAARIVR